METAGRRIIHEVTDRRVARNPAEAIFDYWTTYLAGAVWVSLYIWGSSGAKSDGVILGLLGVMIAITAARDGKKEVHRQVDAIVRRLDEKGLL